MQSNWATSIICPTPVRSRYRRAARAHTLSEFARNGVKAEEEALVLYRKIIETALKMGDIETYELFEKIYADDEAHFFKFQEYVEMEDEPEESGQDVSEWRKIFTDDYFSMLKGGGE